jgi:hypothetical protein
VLDKNRMASGREEAFKACAVSLVAAKRAVFCWQCFSELGLALIVYLRCLLCQCRQFGWHRVYTICVLFLQKLSAVNKLTACHHIVM